MFEIYWPEKLCREFVEARGHSRNLTALMAVVSGHKPCADVWVKPADLRLFLRAVRRYGLIAKQDIIFNVASRNVVPDCIAGKDRLTTTIAYGFHPRQSKHGKHHIFVARSERALSRAFALGWYPVIIGKRVIDRPLADAFRFGEALGYPICCCEFFRWKNNWYRYNFLYEILKNTKRKACYLCNPLGRNETYTYIAHMPCSFDCAVTREHAASFRSFLMKEEPAFVEKIDQHLCLPHLVFYERKIYAFDGKIVPEGIFYKSVYFLGLNNDFNPYLERLSLANELRLEGNNVVLLKDGKKRDVIEYDPVNAPQEIPFILQFGG